MVKYQIIIEKILTLIKRIEMKTLTLNLPDNIDLDEKEISTMLAAQLYDLGKMSLGQAANLVGLSKEEFMNELGKYKVSVFGETLAEIEHDLRNA